MNKKKWVLGITAVAELFTASVVTTRPQAVKTVRPAANPSAQSEIMTKATACAFQALQDDDLNHMQPSTEVSDIFSGTVAYASHNIKDTEVKTRSHFMINNKNQSFIITVGTDDLATSTSLFGNFTAAGRVSVSVKERSYAPGAIIPQNSESTTRTHRDSLLGFFQLCMTPKIQ